MYTPTLMPVPSLHAFIKMNPKGSSSISNYMKYIRLMAKRLT